MNDTKHSSKKMPTRHQMYTPLTIIKGYVSLIQDGTYGIVSDDIKMILERIERSADALVIVIDDYNL